MKRYIFIIIIFIISIFFVIILSLESNGKGGDKIKEISCTMTFGEWGITGQECEPSCTNSMMPNGDIRFCPAVLPKCIPTYGCTR